MVEKEFIYPKLAPPELQNILLLLKQLSMAFTPLKFKFDKDLLELLADKILETSTPFDKIKFQKNTQKLLSPFELKDRVNIIADELNNYLSGNYTKKLSLLIHILGPENKGAYGTFNDFFWTWPIGAFIERHGLDHEDLSITAIKELTKRGTGEFAIRPFIRQNRKKLIQIMTDWSLDENFHVRRLASEGLRPKLPWSSKMVLFIETPKQVFAILENLKNDPERYVQTSVANHINDYFKVNYKEAIALINDWSKHPEIHTRWIIKHAIRNYRKKGVTWALDLTATMNDFG
ncbi:MAG: DNA alkylation repair protein [Saprospiraceae bacterium]